MNDVERKDLLQRVQAMERIFVKVLDGKGLTGADFDSIGHLLGWCHEIRQGLTLLDLEHAMNQRAEEEPT